MLIKNDGNLKLLFRIDNEGKIQVLFVFFWIYYSIISSIVSFGGKIVGLNENGEEIVLKLLIVTVLLFSSSAIIKYIKFCHIMICGVFVAIYLISYLLFPKNTAVMNEHMISFLLGTLPLFFLGCLLDKIRIPYMTLLWASRFTIVLMFLVYMFYNTGNSSIDHDMGRAYVVLPSVMLVSFSVMKKRKMLDVPFMIVGGIFLLICATRGPIFLYVTFVLFQSIFVEKKFRILYVMLLGLVFLLFLTPLGTELILWFMEYFMDRGFHVRIFELFLSGDLTYSNGRDYLSEVVLNMAQQHPFVGNGIFSDRRATTVLAWIKGNGIYVHNIIYEFWCDFGYIIGTFFLVSLFWWIIKAYRNCKADENLKGIFIILTFSYIGKLLFSSSFLEEPGFWVCFGVCYESIMKNKKFRIIGGRGM